MEHRELRGRISEILVRHAMPTNQVAISEIARVVEVEVSRREGEILKKEKQLREYARFVSDVLDGEKPEDAWKKLTEELEAIASIATKK